MYVIWLVVNIDIYFGIEISFIMQSSRLNPSGR